MILATLKKVADSHDLEGELDIPFGVRQMTWQPPQTKKPAGAAEDNGNASGEPY